MKNINEEQISYMDIYNSNKPTSSHVARVPLVEECVEYMYGKRVLGLRPPSLQPVSKTTVQKYNLKQNPSRDIGQMLEQAGKFSPAIPVSREGGPVRSPFIARGFVAKNQQGSYEEDHRKETTREATPWEIELAAKVPLRKEKVLKRTPGCVGGRLADPGLLRTQVVVSGSRRRGAGQPDSVTRSQPSPEQGHGTGGQQFPRPNTQGTRDHYSFPIVLKDSQQSDANTDEQAKLTGTCYSHSRTRGAKASSGRRGHPQSKTPPYHSPAHVIPEALGYHQRLPQRQDTHSKSLGPGDFGAVLGNQAAEAVGGLTQARPVTEGQEDPKDPNYQEPSQGRDPHYAPKYTSPYYQRNAPSVDQSHENWADGPSTVQAYRNPVQTGTAEEPCGDDSPCNSSSGNEQDEVRFGLEQRDSDVLIESDSEEEEEEGQVGSEYTEDWT